MKQTILCHLLLLQPAAAHLALDASLVESFSVRRVHLGKVDDHVNKYVSGVLKNFIQVSATYTFELQENADRQRMQHSCECTKYIYILYIYLIFNQIL